MRKSRLTELEWDKLDAMLQFRPTKRFCADYLCVSEDTIERHIKKKHGLTFTEYKEQKTGFIKLKLQQKAIQQAMSGNSTMLIFCLKNICGWSDHQKDNDNENDGSTKITLNYNLGGVKQDGNDKKED